MLKSNAASRYEDQIEYVEALLQQNPHYIDALEESDQVLFHKYFLPDWEVEGNFLHYYEILSSESPHWEAEAQALLKRFQKANRLHDRIDLY